MSNHGRFCWYELMARDLDAAQAFYADVLGWKAWDSGMPGVDYRLLGPSEGNAVAGLMSVIGGGPPPMWTGYVCVDDVDAATATARDTGSTIHREPMDIPGVGRFAILSDPHGANFAVLQPIANAPEPPADMYDAVGRIGWHELHSGDWQAAWDFYAPLFRWRKGEPFDMGPMGVYQLFGPEELGRDFGGMMNSPGRPPAWLYYFNVDGIDAAVDRAKAGDANLLHGPMQVPSGQWTAILVDPQGAGFALVSGAR